MQVDKEAEQSTEGQRYFLKIAYAGTKYHGWQVQPNAIGVQAVLNDALLQICRGQRVNCIGCGRTDTGVHAHEFFLHFDAAEPLDRHTVHQLNRLLPADISVSNIYTAIQTDVNARFDAIEREYRYFIHQQKTPFLGQFSTWVDQYLDVERMNEAASLLLNFEDFTALSKISKDTLTNICEIRSAKWEHIGGQLVFSVTADRFLRGMVRIMVGSLLRVGKSQRSIADFNTLLESQDRQLAAGAVPAQGLHLWRVKYPANLMKEIE